MSTTTLARPRSDEQIMQDVLRELRWDSCVHDTDIGVIVREGVVTLTGWTGSYGEKIAAETAAHRVNGVLTVANEIEVRPVSAKERTDAEIARAVRSALEWDVLVPHDRIHATVTSGWVVLTGAVPLWRHRNEAERAVRNLEGVKGVTDSLEVAEASIDPIKVREEIKEALERQADLEASRINVRIHDGKVVLSGTVRSWADKLAAGSAATHAPGLVVQDDLVVDQYA